MTSEEEIDRVWQKAKPVTGNDPNVFRKDPCDAWIKKSDHGNRDSQFGWEIDHVDPSGSDNVSNKQPLQWENNVSKSDGANSCKVTSKGNKNVEQESQCGCTNVND